MIKKIIIKLCNLIFFKLDKNTNNNNIITNNTPIFNNVSVKNIIFKNSSNIPKNIYFISVGNDKQYHTKYIINEFKHINYDYKIVHLNYTYDTFFKDNKVWNIVIKKGWNNLSKLDNNQLSSVITDYKFMLLYTYGGIYVSNTCFPIKRFDDNLLRNNYFVLTKNINNQIYDNFNVFGVNHKSNYNNNKCRIYPSICYNDLNYESMKMSYYNCTLKRSMLNIKNENMCSYVYDFGEN
jgi:hypothetical protein